MDITPKDVVPSEKAFNDLRSYRQGLNRIYRDLTSSLYNMQVSDYASDDFEIVLAGFAPTNYYLFQWDYLSLPQSTIWTYQYHLVARANVLIENYIHVVTNTPEEEAEKDLILAVAKGIRAWAFFNIAQLYAPRYDQTNNNELGIPLKLILDLEFLPRASLQETYNQIFRDLNDAQELFKKHPTTKPKQEDLYFSFDENVIAALQSRIYLFIGDKENASIFSAPFIQKTLLTKDNYWKIWEDTRESTNFECVFYTHNLSGTSDESLIDYYEIYKSNSVQLHNDLINSFEASDVRLQYILDKKPIKYFVQVNDRNTTSRKSLYYKHFRLSEQYLIYVESILEKTPQEALRVFNLLRVARGTTPFSQPPTLNQILQERRRELFGEGLRFYDLKRLAKTLNIVVTRSNKKEMLPDGKEYNWLIPKEETNANPYINE